MDLSTGLQGAKVGKQQVQLEVSLKVPPTGKIGQEGGSVLDSGSVLDRWSVLSKVLKPGGAQASIRVPLVQREAGWT